MPKRPPSLKVAVAATFSILADLASSYLRSLAVFLILVSLWVGAGFDFTVATVKSITAMSGPERQGLLFTTGCFIALLLGCRSAIRAFRKRRYHARAEAPAVGFAKIRLSGSHLPQGAPKAALPGWRKVWETYGADYAEWVAARLGSETSEGDIISYAKEWYDSWTHAQEAPRTDESKARHEAAHAVVAHSLGCTITEISIIPEGIAGGHTTIHPAVPRTNLATQSFDLMSALLAGREVDTASAIYDTGAGNDMERLVRAAACVISTGERPAGYEGELSTDALICAASERTRSIVKQYETFIESITEKLLEVKVMTGHELQLLLPARGCFKEK